MKSERLKKLELELQDLEQWLNLGLVPKKDIEKHQQEIEILKKRIEEEKTRLESLKEHGEIDEYSVPKRTGQARSPYVDPHTLPGVNAEETSSMTDVGLDSDMPTTYETESGTILEGEGSPTIDEDEEDPFSDKNRWRRGILEDPDADSW